MKSHISHQLDHWDGAELLWGKRLKGRRENLLQRISAWLVTSDNCYETGSRARECWLSWERHLWGRKREQRNANMNMTVDPWSPRWGQPAQNHLHSVFPPPLSCPLFLLTDKAALIRSSPFGILAGKQKIQSMQGWGCLFFFLFLIFTSWEKLGG